ncbi:type II toxin-antitoxin system YafQ family toxin [Polynucleobacter sp. AP-Sanab-80-C2]|uniref:type II toxin-antitoxin system YafQ family toxin n=1 Tax=unclassified Polynucleobacter TaxID=2640945 RepID=UPI001C0C0BED|nr:type II toxin-antitoxin system YafQ family toxin [Polynucleobacter sp. AP-Sanab-80-C2]MBU3632315.1 type II toxin-antitoxin system YafQ family toxin [Polynucleobacter sp. AP-Feld-500C-C5]MEA9599678.1 type II toxin-antitoxin system YafQ family toxin [Polynucleobacter sp. AP-Sanab-80-C2]
MRMIERSSVFKRDFKRIYANPKHKNNIEQLLLVTIDLLRLDKILPVHSRDHYLIGEWQGHRECHIKPDVLLIYKKPDHQTLRLARLGSHSDLFG